MKNQEDQQTERAMTHSFRMLVVESLAQFRREWEDLAEDRSIVEIQASVGLILCDIAARLELEPKERTLVLGRPLAAQARKATERALGVEIIA